MVMFILFLLLCSFSSMFISNNMPEVFVIESLLEGLMIDNNFQEIVTHEISYFCENVK